MADEKYTIAVNLEAGQAVEGYFSVSGAENDIDFYITDPSGWFPPDQDKVDVEGSYQFAVEAKNSGTYTLWFDNTFSGGKSREITLHYRSR